MKITGVCHVVKITGTGSNSDVAFSINITNISLVDVVHAGNDNVKPNLSLGLTGL